MADTLQANDRIFWFDFVRGLSALAVCAGHLRAAIFCDYGQIPSPHYWHNAFFLLTGLGHQAVIVFFVLSGFFVGGSVLRSRRSFSWVSYAVARLSRLWTVLLPALLFTACIDALTSFLSPSVFRGDFWPLWGSGPQAGKYSADPVTLLLNAMFLQTVACVCYGTNDPLWSLAYEFWFYVLFPLGVSVVTPQVRWQSLVPAAALAVLALALPPALLEAGMIWLLGVLVHGLRNYQHVLNPQVRPVVLFVSLCFFLGMLLITKSQFVAHLLPRWLSSDLIIGLLFANVALQVLWAQPKMLIPLQKLVNWLSDISYTLYLFHFPVVVLCGGVLQGRQLQPTTVALVAYAVLLSLVIGLSYASWWLFERNTHVVRRALLTAAGLRH